MDIWMQILVIILSIFLAIFLLLGIVLLAYLVKISHQIRAITESAERTMAKVETVASNVSVATSPNSIMKVIKTFIKSFKK